MYNVEICSDNKFCRILWNDEHSCRFHVKWLRFNCHCKKCFREFSGLYQVDRLDFGDEINIQTVATKDEKLLMTIDKDLNQEHVIIIPIKWLKKNCFCSSCLYSDISRMEFHNPKLSSVPRVDYTAIFSDKGMLSCLRHVMNQGFCVVENVPQISGILLKVADLFGFLQPTVTGKYFNVKVREKKHNTVHTTLGLPYHEDLPWYQTEPGVQILHALRFDDSVKGGESQLVDVYQAAKILRDKQPGHFKTLTEVPAMFETVDFKREFPAYYRHQKTHIEVDYYGEIVSVHWNPGVEGTPRIPEEKAREYYEAYVAFLDIIRQEDLEYKFRMKTGDTLVFNNHRMVHARNAYETKNGIRHLQGCYVNLDDVRSKYMVLEHKAGNDIKLPAVGNGSSCF